MSEMNSAMEEDQDGGDETFIVPDDLSSVRLDKALAVLCPEISRSRLKVLIQNGEVLLDGVVCADASLKVAAGQEISLTVPPPVAAQPQAEDIPLTIVHEDAHLLVIDKPAGLVVHPGAGNWTGTLVNALLHHCGDTLSGIGGVIRPGIVHRLDKDTSGLMVVAKTDAAHRGLAAQLEDRSLSRTYCALVWKMAQPKGTIDKPIARHANSRMKMTVPTQGGREARTHYRRMAVYRGAVSFIECDLETGRTHQIRVHMSAIGHPLLGDPLYGMQETGQRSLLKKAGYDAPVVAAVLGFPRQALHAARIRFIHPVTGEEMAFARALPQDFAGLVAMFEENS